MIALLQRLCATKLLPLSWTLLIIILLCLPGSAIPGSGIFAIPGVDKIVHIILFGGSVLFWGIYAQQRYSRPLLKGILLITLSGIALGILLEYIQLYFIPNRSFDIKDILADTAGALLAFGFLWVSARTTAKEHADKL